MVRQRLARLERVALKIGAMQETRAPRCSHCHGRNGVGGVPLMMILGKSDANNSPYSADRRCSRCGAEPPIVVDVVALGMPSAVVARD